VEKNSEISANLVVGIDASNLRQGGGVTHLVELLRLAEPDRHRISRVMVWGGKNTLAELEDRSWLVKVSPPDLDGGLFRRTLWQLTGLSRAARQAGCDLLYVPGGLYFSSFRPVVTMSRNLLPFEWREARRYGWSLTSIRLALLRWAQSRSFHQSDCVIFLTKYAKECVQRVTGELVRRSCIIPHGVSPRFLMAPRPQKPISEYTEERPYRLIYVSIINLYKHQSKVVEAVALCRAAGLPLSLNLVGPANSQALLRLNQVLAKFDPKGEWVKYLGEVPFSILHEKYAEADLGIFASSCENMPNTLLETMAAGLPVASSNLGPMPEILRDAGVYFDPENSDDIARALLELINSPALRTTLAQASYRLANTYSWKQCADDTFSLLARVSFQSRHSLCVDGMVVGIDASRNRSGGAKAHLIGLLTESNPAKHGIREVHVWAYKSLLDLIPDSPWLIKHNPLALEKSLLRQVWWQRFRFSTEARAAGCSIVLNTDAGTVSGFHPSITMSRDMLSYEPGEIERFGISKARLRLVLLRFIQNRALRQSTGVIFLTQHAAHVIQQSCGPLDRIAYIPHGVGDNFKRAIPTRPWPVADERPIHCIYVSNAALYKHQWVVVEAVAALRNRGFDIALTLVGGGAGKAQQLLDQQIAVSDPNNCFVRQLDFVPQQDLPQLLASADMFVFASSCENMPNTLVEAMAVGLPIACSNSGPMPEVLADGGVYFNPEDANSIALAVEQLIVDPARRSELAQRARQLSKLYSWSRCADETWAFVADTYKHPQATTRTYQICSNCVMDTTDAQIVFDDKGVCDHCNTFYKQTLPNWLADDRGRESLAALVDEIKRAGVGKDFDCIIGMSGGIDSSYLTYIAKEQFGLRPLVFHVDAGWNSQEAVNNIEKLVDKLGLDLYTEVIDWAEMRDLQLAFFKSGVPHIDAPQDHAFFATMYKFAEEHKVKYILTGANLSTECIRNPIEWMYYQSDSVQLRDIHRQFGTRPLDKFPLTSILRHKVYLPYIKGIKVMRPLNLIPYIKQDAIKLLVEKFGWQPYPQKHFESRFTRFYEGYWLPKKFGYDTRRVQFSSLIVTGQMTRDEALEKLLGPSYDAATIAQDFEYIATKLGISVAELQGYMDAPNRTYRDFKSQEHIYALGATAMKVLGLEVGGKR
jgi:N-acetyl sugar amidotransferase